MKRILIAAASAVAMVCTTFADATTWFDTKIQDLTAWPTNNVEEFGGLWSNTGSATRLDDYDGTNALEIAAATNAPLTFAASITNSLDAHFMTFTSTIEFTPFNYDELPEVPENAKGGVISVKNGTSNTWYVLDKDPQSNANKWTDTKYAATTEATKITTAITNDFGKAYKVTYTIGSHPAVAATIVATAGVDIATVSYTGDGVVSSLSATYERRLIDLAKLKPENSDNIYIESVTTNDHEVADKADGKAYYGDQITVVYKTLYGGKVFSSGSDTFTWSGTVTDNINTGIDEEEVLDSQARIGETYYLTLQHAVDAATENDTVVLVANIEQDSTLYVTNKSVVIDFLDGVTSHSLGTDVDVDWVIWAEKDLVITNGDITAANCGVYVKDNAGLALYGTLITSSNRTIQVDAENADGKPGAFFMDETSEIESEYADGFYCRNCKSDVDEEDFSRDVTINGSVTSPLRNSLIGNNVAVINGSLSVDEDTNALYYSNEWIEGEETKSVSSAYLTINGQISNSYDSSDSAAVYAYNDGNGNANMTIGDEDAVISCSTNAFKWDVLWGDLAITNGTFVGTIDVIIDPEFGCPVATEFISGGYFSEKPDAAYIAEGYKAVESTAKPGYWHVTNGEAPEPTTCTFTLTPDIAGTTVKVYTNGVVEVNAGTSGYTVLSNAAVKIVYTADTGKLFADGTDTKTLEKTISKDTEVDVSSIDTPTDAEAQIGTTYYLTLQKALDAAEAGETITLCADIETATKEQWTIAKNITIDFNGKTITKTIANDWVFTVANGATVVFQDSTGNVGGIKHYPTQKNQSSPASMIQNKGNLTIKSGKYESDFCVIKNDEDPGAGELTIDGGVFTVATAHQGYTGKQWALMNWAKATINGGTWTGVIGTRSCDGNKVSKFGTTVIAGNLGTGATYLLFVGYPKDTTYANVPKIKGVAKSAVTLGQVDTITDELELVEDGEYVTVAKTAATTYDITITEPTNGTLETSVTNGVAAGTTVTVTATPAQGYTLEAITTNGTAITGTTFDMPAENVTVAATFKTAGQSVAPGGSPVDVKAESAEEATNGVEVVVSSPDTQIVSDAEYKDYFYVKATDLGEGTYRLTAELKPEIVAAEDETAEVAEELSDIASGTATSVEVTNAKPGLWYSVEYTDDVSAMATAAEGDRDQADANGNVTIATPKTSADATKQFYRVKVSTTNKGTVQ